MKTNYSEKHDKLTLNIVVNDKEYIRFFYDRRGVGVSAKMMNRNIAAETVIKILDKKLCDKKDDRAYGTRLTELAGEIERIGGNTFEDLLNIFR